MNQPSPSQIASWYHSQILRIPHGKQHPSKRYLTDDQVLELFDGMVVIQEKVDGKLSWSVSPYTKYGIHVTMYEDMTGKHTIHDHVMKYTNLPTDKYITLDYVKYDEYGHDVMTATNGLSYGVLSLESPSLEQIHIIIGGIAQSSSHFGADRIEGLVIKNYNKQRFGKWINDEFEDRLGDD